MTHETSKRDIPNWVLFAFMAIWLSCLILGIARTDSRKEFLYVFSSLTTVIGYPLALLFFWASGRQVTGIHKDLSERIEGKALSGGDARSGDSEAAPEGTEPINSEGSDSVIDLKDYWTVRWENSELRTYRIYQTPIRVVGDLYQRWVQDDRQGKYYFSEIEWIARRSGRGNNPWYVRFKNKNDMYRVSYGGRKGCATVTKHPVPPELLDDENWTRRRETP